MNTLTTGQYITIWIGFIWGLFGIAGMGLIIVDISQKIKGIHNSILAKWNWVSASIMVGFMVFLFATLISAAITG